MAVFRVEKTKDFTIMSNYHLRDKNLSLKAKGLLSQMLSLPEEWDYTLAGLAHINKESSFIISHLRDFCIMRCVSVNSSSILHALLKCATILPYSSG
jgi:hypothetical protein